MPAGKHKSSRFRKVFVKTPGGRTTLHRRERNPKQAKCSVTGEKLNGIKRLRPSNARNSKKSTKTSNRPYGGVLSSKAMRAKFKEKAKEVRLE